MRPVLLAPLFVGAAMSLVACGDDQDAADQPRVVEDPPRMDLEGEPPYGPGVEAGATYDYVLYTHCGVEWAPIDGVWWRTDPLGVADANPPDGWGNPYDAGSLTVTGDDTATYTSDTGIDIELRRTATAEAPFRCE